MTVELAELIGQLRSELSAALHAGESSDLRFELGPVELELTVAVGRDDKPGGKVRFWVAELGTEVTNTSNTTQRIKLTLEPRRVAQPDRRPLISGDAVAGER